MIDHIYGRVNVISRNDRPNMFVKELGLYLDYLKNKIDEAKNSMSIKQEKYLATFINNLKEGISYYQGLFSGLKDKFESTKTNIFQDLEASKKVLDHLNSQIVRPVLVKEVA